MPLKLNREWKQKKWHIPAPSCMEIECISYLENFFARRKYELNHFWKAKRMERVVMQYSLTNCTRISIKLKCSLKSTSSWVTKSFKTQQFCTWNPNRERERGERPQKPVKCAMSSVTLLQLLYEDEGPSQKEKRKKKHADWKFSTLSSSSKLLGFTDLPSKLWEQECVDGRSKIL